MDSKVLHCDSGQLDSFLGQLVELTGWLEVVRDHGKIVFWEIEDSCGRVQCVFKQGAPHARIKSVVSVCGYVQKTGERLELLVHNTKVRSSGTPDHSHLDKISSADFRKRMRMLSDELLSWRNHLHSLGFIECFTPVLGVDTPEGSNLFSTTQGDYFLSQSPQLYKQVLMSCRVGKYYQVAPCFRNENTRHHRQPEFHQLDVEQCGASGSDMMAMIENLLKVKPATMSWSESMSDFFTDSPDIRKPEWGIRKSQNGFVFSVPMDYRELLMQTAEEFVFDCEFKEQDAFEVFCSRSELKNLQSLRTFFLDRVCDEQCFVWIVDAPLFVEKDGKLKSVHHPFTAAKAGDFAHPLEMIGSSFDLIFNGREVAGGSERITDLDTQNLVLDLLQCDKTLLNGFLTALSRGMPPMVGWALGIERYFSVKNRVSIRESMFFPKSSRGKCLVFDQ